MSASMDLTTTAKLKIYLGIAETDTSEDDLLAQLIAQNSKRIEAYCQRHFASSTLTDDFNGTGTNSLVLATRPLTQLTSVKIDCARSFPAESEIDTEELSLDSEAGIITRIDNIFPRGVRNVRVVYVAGFSTVPDDINLACIKLAAASYAHAKSGADGIKSERIGEYSVEYEREDISPEVEGILESYIEYPQE